ncbi:MAG: hypothetical protein ACI81A_000926 [Paraglaciecola sp.]
MIFWGIFKHLKAKACPINAIVLYPTGSQSL